MPLLMIAISIKCKNICFGVVPSKVNGVSLSPMVTSNQPSLRVTWSPPSSDRTIRHYQVDYRVGTSGSWSTWSPNPTSTSVTLTGLQRGITYQVRVRAVSDVGNGAWSNTVSRTTYDGTFLYTYTAKNLIVDGFYYVALEMQYNLDAIAYDSNIN